VRRARTVSADRATREHVEWRRHIGASRFDAGRETRPRKHLERTCEVKHLNIIEEEIPVFSFFMLHS